MSFGTTHAWDASASARYRNVQGLTFATLGAGDLNIRNRPLLDLSGLNRDVANMTRVTSSTSWAFAIPSLNLAKLQQDIANSANYINALTANVPQRAKDEGEQGVKLFQTALLYGMSQEEARAFLQSEQFQDLLSRRRNWESVRAALGDHAMPTARLAMAIASGEQLIFDSNDQQWYVRTDCGNLGPADWCRIPLSELRGYDRAKLNGLVDDMFKKLVDPNLSVQERIAVAADTIACVLLFTYETKQPDAFRALLRHPATLQYTFSAFETLSKAFLESGANLSSGNWEQIRYELTAAMVFGAAGKGLRDLTAKEAREIVEATLAANARAAASGASKAELRALEVSIAHAMDGASAKALASVDDDIAAAAQRAGAPFLNQGKSTVYVAYKDGNVVYVGITDNFERRAGEQLLGKNITIQTIQRAGGSLDNLTRADARAVEQALIEITGLGKDGGSLMNKINSIAQGNPKYSDALLRGLSILSKVGY